MGSIRPSQHNLIENNVSDVIAEIVINICAYEYVSNRRELSTVEGSQENSRHLYPRILRQNRIQLSLTWISMIVLSSWPPL